MIHITSKAVSLTFVSLSLAFTVAMVTPSSWLSRMFLSMRRGSNFGANKLRLIVTKTVAVATFAGVPPSFTVTRIYETPHTTGQPWLSLYSSPIKFTVSIITPIGRISTANRVRHVSTATFMRHISTATVMRDFTIATFMRHRWALKTYWQGTLALLTMSSVLPWYLQCRSRLSLHAEKTSTWWVHSRGWSGSRLVPCCLQWWCTQACCTAPEE